jgi:hypothetical protein
MGWIEGQRVRRCIQISKAGWPVLGKFRWPGFLWHDFSMLGTAIIPIHLHFRFVTSDIGSVAVAARDKRGY